MIVSDSHEAIIGASGAGKSTTARVEVEALLDEGRHVCIIDPTGIWHGLRSNAAGDGPGFGIPIFGGDHGDVAVLPEQGEAVGKIIAGGVSAIVDVSGMDGRQQRRFVLGMMAALRKKPKANFHLVVDEADEFAPQTAPDDIGFELVEQMKWVAKRGRVHGFVLTAITQRPADISKAVLSQVQTIIAHQLIAPQDQKAIDDYLKANGDPETRRKVMTSLPALERGQRWIYSPRAGVLELGMTPLPKTFDSSRTPAAGETLAAPKMLAQIDLGAIREALAPPPPAADAAVKGAAMGDTSAEIGQLRARLAEIEDEHSIEIATGQQQLTFLTDALRQVQKIVAAALDPARRDDAQVLRLPERLEAEPVAPATPVESVRPQQAPLPLPRATSSLTRAAERMLHKVVQMHPRALSIEHIAKMAGVSTASSQWRANVRSLLDSGYVDVTQASLIELNGAGRRTFDVAKQPDTPDATRAFWLSAFTPSVSAMLRVMIDHGDWIDRDSVAERAGVSKTSSGLAGGLRELREHRLIEVRNGREYRIAGVLR